MTPEHIKDLKALGESMVAAAEALMSPHSVSASMLHDKNEEISRLAEENKRYELYVEELRESIENTSGYKAQIKRLAAQVMRLEQNIKEQNAATPIWYDNSVDNVLDYVERNKHAYIHQAYDQTSRRLMWIVLPPFPPLVRFFKGET